MEVLTQIPARSRRQAMDWSLVLVSQGIESTIERDAETGRWLLLINPRDSEKAFKTLRQYRVENRGWPWPDALTWKGPHFDWTAVLWVVPLVAIHLLGNFRPVIVNRGIMDSSSVLAGQWWRIFTATMLHSDSAHLAANLSIGVVLFGLAMARYGRGPALLAACLAGAVGNVTSLMINPKPFDGLGASGMVMGALGLISAQTLQRGQWNRPALKYTLSGVIAGVLLFILYGLAPNSDIVAHAGGFISGLVLGAILVFLPERFASAPIFRIFCAVTIALTVSLAWALAFAV